MKLTRAIKINFIKLKLFSYKICIANIYGNLRTRIVGTKRSGTGAFTSFLWWKCNQLAHELEYFFCKTFATWRKICFAYVVLQLPAYFPTKWWWARNDVTLIYFRLICSDFSVEIIFKMLFKTILIYIQISIHHELFKCMLILLILHALFRLYANTFIWKNRTNSRRLKWFWLK